MGKPAKIKAGRVGPPPLKDGILYVNAYQEDQMEIYGYAKNQGKEIFMWILYFLTVGLLRLFFFWYPHLMIAATHEKSSLKHAVVVVLKDQYNQWFVAKVKLKERNGRDVQNPENHQETKVEGISYKKGHLPNTPLKQGDVVREQSLVRFFITKKVKYVWNTNSQEFEKAKGLDHSTRCSYFHEALGLSHLEQSQRRNVYGSNSIQIHVTPIITLLFKEVLSPFYIFQLFSCCLWYADEYYYYASAIVLMSVISITVTVYQTRQMQRALRNTIHSSSIVTVCRGGDEYIEISSEDLVPGDVIEIPRYGCIMQCDAVLVAGNCIVNESMLTGESVPVTKTPLPNPKMSKSQEDIFFQIKEHSRHVLFCGTHIIQTRYYGTHKVRAVVLRTGFTTAKGELVRSIMYPKPVDFKFNRDTYIFVGALAAIAGIGFIYTIVLMVQAGEHPSDIIIRSLDLITIAVPPALPAALTIGIVFAQYRLKKQLVYCISPRSINVSGSINTFCFDKTGTLTEDGLDMHSVVPVENDNLDKEYTDLSKVDNDSFISAMATCHSLTRIEGVLSGDPLDLIMFEATGWELIEEGEDSSKFDMIAPTIVRPKSDESRSFDQHFKPLQKEIGIIRQFTFSSSLQRMSVIVRMLGSQHFDLFAKGAPEKIIQLSKPDTVPNDYHDKLMKYTQHGYRVLALAWRQLPAKLKYTKIQRIQREQVEKGLTFLGFLVTENRVKPETTPVITQLRQANIRTVMVTGDNMLTALSVAREIGMVPPKEKIVLVQGYPESGKVEAYIEFVYAEEYKQETSKTGSASIEEVAVDILSRDDGNNFHFAIDGRSWSVVRTHFDDLLQKLCVRGTVFARFSPEQKGQLIETLQELGYFVGMCGDGANDCGALKTAHAGISLSEAEASVASPFTSKKPNIECVPTLIREGRAALTTSSGIFKYMAMYSLIQFLTVCILYWISNNLTDFEFLYIDLFILTTLSITFGATGAYDKLHPEPPLINLFSIGPILTLILQTGIQAAAQVFVYLNVQTQPWFTPFVDNEDDAYESYENASVFLISSYQYIILAIVFSKGKPYRNTICSNYFFLANIVFCLACTVWLHIEPLEFFREFMELADIPSMEYKLIYLGIVAINFILSFLVESYFCDSYLISRKLQEKIKENFFNSQLKYKALEEEISQSTHWPPVSSTTDLVEVFQRMDSAVSADIDRTSLMSSLADSASETGSLRIKNIESVGTLDTQGSMATLDTQGSMTTLDTQGSMATLDTQGSMATLDTPGSMDTLDTQISTVDDEAQLIETGVDNPGFVEDSHSTTTTNL
ncbi:Probable cation-transporting ATPase 13A3,Probable cation-transporting ATPase W08D2.5,Probable cation-transporting ATPase 13A4,Cation-transporting ATPase 13A2 [Mytilus edulis]|uniref:Cation-transporting ATPase n=1 Tax=Mytilus edulis TaxID=6550 RepID=A0A8S3UXB4_MYTED|nr:Probable cation-transporting ATPase 13A3,Probable cation-transporting ATPase W08D2.5,Probable cation-transporting ATPase 13A4,Cation-transporting ATPase 13A2 [Mytilus edulis]